MLFSIRSQIHSKRMEEHQVVPDVLDVIPPNVIEVSYPGGHAVALGNELAPKLVKDIPELRWPTEEGALYTLCMTDPDAPTRTDPKNGEFKHWLVINIPGLDIQSGKTLAGYIGSGPPRGSGLHRYIFVVYRQPGTLDISGKCVSNRDLEGRHKFKIRDFARNHGLGEPIAGNFFQAKWDSYVPRLYAQFAMAMITKRCSIM
ncbi:unnamed protein product [Oppiella nova]|uniref:Uncharacterized protein n=1 Tax=Oppiella nova TaxID=334625 RepID=A0A7R9MHY7_9ACAR|nr:unnamed protein product [Oppiella nova]CAG2176541.1 unnamed protein product [Oppiella nova]